MNCPNCNSAANVKDGIVKNRQRYLCKECNYRYTVEQRGAPAHFKKLALQMFIEGVSYRNIGNILKVSQVSIMRWVRTFRPEITKGIKRKVDQICLEELDKYLKERKTIINDGLLIISMDKKSTILCIVKKLK